MVKTISLYGFTSNESTAAVTEFLEAYTGNGTVSAIDFVPLEEGKERTFALVEFIQENYADMMIPLAKDKNLRYKESYLKARKFEFDILQKSMDFPDQNLKVENDEHNMEFVKLHFGCLVSKEQFSTLWETSDVSVKFGMEFKNMSLELSHDSVDYKLEISTESVSKIELHCPGAQVTKFLLVQLLAAPRIFKKVSERGWVREVDFTPSCCIGQSSAVCLELLESCKLPKLHRICVYYEENEGQFVLERGKTFSSTSSDLVPIVCPPVGIHLPYKILFKINSLVQTGRVPGQALDVSFYELVDPNRVRIEYIESALDKLFRLKACCYEPVTWLSEQYRDYKESKQIPQSPAISLEEGLVYVHRVQVTPTRVYFCGPQISLSNRVLRNYPQDGHRFVRVSFVDEDLGKIHSKDLCQSSNFTTSIDKEQTTRVYERILSTLKNGIVIGENKFEFLAFSASQQREQSVWMFASRRGLTAQDIRNWMGDFSDIRNVSKYAARLGQAFSSSRESFDVGSDEIDFIRDVETESRGVKYCFSDGIGKISAEFAERVANKCGLSSTPSAFQIRHGGHKGVVAVDPTLSKKLAFRDSMRKYQSNNTTLDILAWTRYQPCFLNREVITLLSTLGVADRVFMNLQRQALKQLKGVLTDPSRAREALEVIFKGDFTNILKEMLMCGYKPDAEPFLALMLQAFCASKLVELRTKTRIFVPKGRSLMGCLDETGTLEYGQIFMQCSNRAILNVNGSSSSSEDKFVVQGKVVVAKNPCLHPGDVRVLTAVDVPALQHMVDCVVFPKKGHRPHPNECSGSDLDGDVYFVIWDPDLIPPQKVPPMNYRPPPTIELNHDVTMEEVQESFTNYIVNDNLGIISNAHKVFADREPQKARSRPCIRLAKLCSHAVDTAKTGVPVKLPHDLLVHEYPDFMEKVDKDTYQSKGVLGKLFREVKNVELASDSASDSGSITSFSVEVATKSYDRDMEVEGFEDHIYGAIKCKIQYDYKLGNLMDYYGVKTEAEILSGSSSTMLKHSRGDDLESINYAVKSLRKEARAWFYEKQGDLSGGDPAKASAWYHVTYHPSYWGHCNTGMERDHFLSFPWCVFDKLIEIKRDKASIRNFLLMSSLKGNHT